MNKAQEFHQLAEKSQFYNDEIKEILKACKKSASLGLYNCCFLKTRLDKDNQVIIINRLSEMGFIIKISSDSEYWEVHW